MRQAASSRLVDMMGRKRALSFAEQVADGIVHGVGLVVALVAGSVLITLSAINAEPADVVVLSVYLGTLIALLCASLAYNLAPVGTLKAWFARFDQAAIFLFIAGTYTPLLVAASGDPAVELMLVAVWVAAILGMALKLWVPHRFGRVAILLYLGIGWSGLFAIEALADALPPQAIWLLVLGGAAYTAGIVFHLWESMRFQVVIWHGFVLLGAFLHLAAIYASVFAQ